jgi:amidohydrolase
VTRDDLKKRICDAIQAKAGEIISLGEDIFAHPELGYKEFGTSAKVAARLKELGLEPQTGIAITGLKARLPGRQSQVTCCVMGELDSVLCPGHPHADPLTGAAHSCGHNAQAAAMVGVGMGLVDSGAMEHLGGDVVLAAVPAEEYVEIEYRSKLRREGKITFLGGKQEFIAAGALDDVDMAMMVHAGPLPDHKMSVGGSNNGFIGKFVRFRGKEAHAGGAPHAGINALNAAMLGLMGIHANRETFKDEDTIRVHPIITKGGDLVNIIPADVRMETYVRGKRMEAIMDASRKVDRALQAGAMAVGAELEIETLPGYLPRFSEPKMDQLYRANAEAVLGPGTVSEGEHTTGSTDMGDVAHLMPSIHPRVGGVTGRGHSEDYEIVDPQLTYVDTAKVIAMTVIDLLWDDAAKAHEIRSGFRAIFTKEAYLKMWAELLA